MPCCFLVQKLENLFGKWLKDCVSECQHPQRNCGHLWCHFWADLQMFGKTFATGCFTHITQRPNYVQSNILSRSHGWEIEVLPIMEEGFSFKWGICDWNPSFSALVMSHEDKPHCDLNNDLIYCFQKGLQKRKKMSSFTFSEEHVSGYFPWKCRSLRCLGWLLWHWNVLLSGCQGAVVGCLVVIYWLCCSLCIPDEKSDYKWNNSALYELISSHNKTFNFVP